MGKDVTFNINLKLNGEDAVKNVSVDIDEIRRAIDMATIALNIAVMAPYATFTCGISFAVSSLASLFYSMGNGVEKAAEKTNVLKDAEDAYVQENARMKSGLDAEVK